MRVSARPRRSKGRIKRKEGQNSRSKAAAACVHVPAIVRAALISVVLTSATLVSARSLRWVRNRQSTRHNLRGPREGRLEKRVVLRSLWGMPNPRRRLEPLISDGDTVDDGFEETRGDV